MFQNLKLTAKMVLGFGTLVLIAVILGSLAVYNMNKVVTKSEMLSQEYVPEVDIAVELRGAANRTMYEMRGYGFTEDEKFYQNAQKEVQAVNTAIGKAKELSAKSPHLVKLKDRIGDAEKAINTYEGLMEKTNATNASLGEDRAMMDQSAKTYMSACANFLTGQNNAMKEEIRSGAKDAALLERNRKINLVNDIIDLGNACRIAAWRSQAQRDPAIVQNALSNFDEIEKLMQELSAITRKAQDIEEIATTRKASHQYKTAMEDLLKNWFTLQEIGKGREVAGKDLIEVTKNTADAGIQATDNIAKEAVSALKSSSNVMVIGLVIAAILGVILAYFITRSIVTPIKDLSDIANNLAKGDLDQVVDIKSKDEVGMLGVAFSTMIAEQKKKARAIESVAKGDMNVDITMGCEKDLLSKSVNVLKDNISALLKETNGLIQASLDGKLDTRGKADNFTGGWKDMVQGVNNLLDAIISPIKEAMKVMSQAANKKLSVRVEGDYKGQLGEFKDNINEAINALDEALGQVRSSVEQVSSASNQISSGSQTLSQGAQEQASSLEEISSSLEEMASMTKQNSENANQAKSLAASAKNSAEKGNTSMKEMMSAINLIKNSSDETAKIVKTIDEIAFQTNLLALNAAVEAARAGEAGRGFAVVAEEVRNLASRSAEAAKNTASMIEESVKNAEGGVNITQEVAKFLEEITDGSGKVNDLIGEIAAASGEQSKGIEQVNIAVGQMNQITQQNAANSEESASAAEELNSQSEELAAMVGTFELSRTSGSSAANTLHRAPQKRIGSPAMAGVSSGNNGHRGMKNGSAENLIPMDDLDLNGF